MHLIKTLLDTSLVLLGVDTLGKVDPSTLSHETLLELLTADLSTLKLITKLDNSSDDISGWKGVRMNDSAEVVEITWHWRDLIGSLDFRYLPSSLTILRIGGNYLQGTINFTRFPNGLQEIEMDENQFSGEISLESLPSDLEKLDLSVNALSGTLDLTGLPKSLQELDLHENEFEGSINLTNLPKTLMKLNISENYLVGETDFTQLPKTLTHVDLTNNPALSGDITKPSEMTLYVKGTKINVTNSFFGIVV